jgi:hypothetical protein
VRKPSSQAWILEGLTSLGISARLRSSVWGPICVAL